MSANSDGKRRKRLNMTKAQLIEELECLESNQAKQADLLQALSNSNRRLRDFTEASSDWYWEMGADLRFTSVSEQYEYISGISPGAVVGLTREELSRGDVNDEYWMRHFADLKAHRPFRNFRYVYTAEDGNVFHYSTSGVPVFDERDCFLGYRGTGSNVTTEVEAEREAIRARDQLQEAVEAVPDGFVLYDNEDRLVLCNQKYREIYAGHSDLFVLGNLFEDMLREGVSRGDFPEAIGREEEWIRSRVHKHQNPTGGAIEQKLSNGTVMRIAERRTRDGGIVGTRTDITGIKAVENALTESEERFRDIAESSSDWFWEMGPTFKFTYVTESFHDIVGIDPKILIGKSRQGLEVKGQDPEKWEKHLDDQASHRAYRNFEYEIQLPDGTSRHISVSGKPVFGVGGEFKGYRGTGTNVTMQVLAERRAAQAQQRLQDAIEAIDDGFVLYGSDDRLLISNSKYEEYYKESADLIVPGAKFEHIISEGAKRGQYIDAIGRVEEWVAERMQRYRKAGEVYEQELDDGRWLQVSERRMRDGCTVGLRVDITELMETQKQLRASKEEAELANRTKSEFLANMSHELRTPLNAIIGFSDSIRHEIHGPVGNEKYLGYIDDIYSSGNHLLDLINDILDVSAIEAGKLELHEENLDVGNVIATTMQLIIGRADAGNVRLVGNTDDDLPMLRADKRRMMQILLNLLSNAVKFTLPGGRAVLTASLDGGGGHTFTVTDTGVGMDKKEMAKAMSEFGQVDRSLSRKQEGTGLGLPLTQGLTELHGGTFDIESEKGKGTTVRVRLPPARTVVS